MVNTLEKNNMTAAAIQLSKRDEVSFGSRLVQRVKQLIVGFAALPLTLIDRRGFFRGTGWVRTMFANRSVDWKGEPIPWWSYSLIHFLDERLKPDLRVFEYGSGGSTLWLAKRVKEIISNETDHDWYYYIMKRAPHNATVRNPPRTEDLWRTITGLGEFDIIIVDDFDRVASIRNAPTFLTERGVIIVDDTNQAHLQAAIRSLRERGFRQLDFKDLAPCKTQIHSTGLFYRDGNCLGL